MKNSGAPIIFRMKNNFAKVYVVLTLVLCIDVMGNPSTTLQIGVILDNSDISKDLLAAMEIALTVTGGYIDDHSELSIGKIVNFTDLTDGYALSDSICWQTERMVFALFGLSYPVTYDVVQSYSQNLHVPWITANPTRTSTFEPNTFHISMCPNFVDAVADFIKYFEWKKIYYLYDSNDGLWRLQRLSEAFKPPSKPLAVDAREIPNPWDVYDILRQLDRSDSCPERRVVLDLSSKEAYKAFMTQVTDVGMNRDGYHYILGFLSITDLDFTVFQHGGVNITGFQFVDDSRDLVQSFYEEWRHSVGEQRLDLKITPPLEAALTIDGIAVVTYALKSIWDNDRLRRRVFLTRRGQLYNSNVSRGLDCRENPVTPFLCGDIIMDAMKNASFIGVSGHVQFDKHGQRHGFKLDVYQLQYKTEMRKIGYWSREGFKTNLTKSEDKEIDKDISNITLRITTIMEPPYVMLKSKNDDGNQLEQYEGYIFDLAEIISTIVGFNYHIHLVRDSRYGSQFNGTWNGMIGELINNQADIAMAPLTITTQRLYYVDFTEPFQKTGISLMVKKPETQQPGVLSFKDPLSNYIWLCVGIGFLAVSLILFLVGRFSPYERVNQSSKDTSKRFSLANTFWFSLGALMEQGSDISPRSASGRVVAFVWWFFTLILVSSYTANLAAFLAVERLVLPITSVNDLVGQTSIQYGILNGGASYYFFKTSNVEVYRQMFNVMTEAVPSVFVNSNYEGWEKVASSEGNYAFLLESTINEYLNHKMPCRTMKVGGLLDERGYGIATRIGSDLSSKLNLAVLQLHETGELLKLQKRWWYDKGHCTVVDSKVDRSSRTMTLSNVSGIFYILMVGLLTSMLVAFFEFVIKRKAGQTQKRQSSKTDDRTQSEPVDTNVNRSHGEVTVLDTQFPGFAGFTYST